MKKLISICIILAMLCGTTVLPFASAEVNENPTVLFEDNFDSYTDTTSFIEDNVEFRKNWSNDLIEYNLDFKDGEGNTYPNDTECKEAAKVIVDPTNAENKVLHIKNYDPIGSFFYIAPKAVSGDNLAFNQGAGLKVRDFEVTFKVYNMRSELGPWMGISARKTDNVRYNGTNNELLTLKTSGTADGYHAVSYLPLRGYGGSGSPSAQDILLDTVKDVYGGINKYQEANPNFVQNNIRNLTDGVVDPAKKLMNNWITYRFIVSKDAEKPGSNYACYAYYAGGTEVYLGSFYYSSTSVNEEGYLSFNACVTDAYIDDFKVTELTGYSNPVFDIGDPSNGATTVIAKTVADKEQVVDTELAINLTDMFTVDGDSSYVTYEASAGTIESGVWKYTPTAENARTITVKAKNSSDDSEVSLTFKVTGVKASGGETGGGCGGIGSNGLSAILLFLGVTLLAIAAKKKKNKA